jgi:hypothetical protein
MFFLDGPCNMGMIVADGCGLDASEKTFECLRCGYIDKPDSRDRREATV